MLFIRLWWATEYFSVHSLYTPCNIPVLVQPLASSGPAPALIIYFTSIISV